MGCDIHLHVEKQNPLGEWEHVPDPEGADWADPRRWYHGRNYNLFAILADVRNGHGFAGVRTGDGFNPIDNPRGLPDDVSADVRKMSDDWDTDGHSHSWLTVGEVLAYDWDQTSRLTGLFVDTDNGRYAGGGKAAAIQDYADRYHELPPWVGEWCADVSGPPHLVAKYKRVTWEQPYHHCVSTEWWATVARAYRISEGGPAGVRFVFWFDN